MTTIKYFSYKTRTSFLTSFSYLLACLQREHNHLGTKGDSGGLVFGEDANMKYCAAGIYIGRGILNGKTVSTSVIANNANASLGVTRY